MMDTIVEEIKKALSINVDESVEISSQYKFIKLDDQLFEPMSQFHEAKFNITKESYNKQYLSISSSSMLSFNFLGNGPVTYDTQDYAVAYERRLKAPYGSYADFDMSLQNEENNHLILIESKFLEPLSNSIIWINDTYLRKDKFYTCDKDFVMFHEAIKKVISEQTKIDRVGLLKYASKYNVFDVFQIIKHLKAIYYNAGKLKKQGIKKIDLYVLHWVPDESYIDRSFQHQKEILTKAFQQYDFEFKKCIQIIQPIINEIQKEIEFSIIKKTYKEFSEKLAISDSKKSFLKRYMINF